MAGIDLLEFHVLHAMQNLVRDGLNGRDACMIRDCVSLIASVPARDSSLLYDLER